MGQPRDCQIFVAHLHTDTKVCKPIPGKCCACAYQRLLWRVVEPFVPPCFPNPMPCARRE